MKATQQKDLESTRRSDDPITVQLSLYKDVLGGLLILLLTLALFVPAVSEIYVDPRDPGFGSRDFPVGVLVLLVFLSSVLLLHPVYRWMRQRSDWHWRIPWQMTPLFRHVVPMMSLGFGYTWLVDMFQYFLPTLLVTASAMAIYGNRGLWRLFVIPLLVSVFFYLLFFGVLGLYEEPGSVLAYHNRSLFDPFREALGTVFTW